jgi:hypothetical protein
MSSLAGSSQVNRDSPPPVGGELRFKALSGQPVERRAPALGWDHERRFRLRWRCGIRGWPPTITLTRRLAAGANG